MLHGLAYFQKHSPFCLLTSPVYTVITSFYGCDDWDSIICLDSSTPSFMFWQRLVLSGARLGQSPSFADGTVSPAIARRSTQTQTPYFDKVGKLQTIGIVPSRDKGEGTHTCKGDGNLISPSVEPHISLALTHAHTPGGSQTPVNAARRPGQQHPPPQFILAGTGAEERQRQMCDDTHVRMVSNVGPHARLHNEREGGMGWGALDWRVIISSPACSYNQRPEKRRKRRRRKKKLLLRLLWFHDVTLSTWASSLTSISARAQNIWQCATVSKGHSVKGVSLVPFP